MDSTYNRGYYTSYNHISYENSTVWEAFFRSIAEHIVQELSPKTVLDVGCASGYLVAQLRDLGVEAYGFDISSEAIARVREDIRPYCRVHSLLDDSPIEGFPEQFDLVTNIEVLEHLYMSNAQQAVQLLCRYGDYILFSSSSSAIEDKTHINVQQPEYWVHLFAQQGFYRSMVYDPSFISSNALFFTRQQLDIPHLAENYERYVRLLRMQHDTTLRQKDWVSFTAQLHFDCGEGFPGPLQQQDFFGPDVYWKTVLPENTREIQLIPAAGHRCIIESLHIQVGGVDCLLLDADNQSFFSLTAPLLLPGEPIRADIKVAEGLLHPIEVEVFAKIYLLENSPALTHLLVYKDKLTATKQTLSDLHEQKNMLQQQVEKQEDMWQQQKQDAISQEFALQKQLKQARHDVQWFSELVHSMSFRHEGELKKLIAERNRHADLYLAITQSTSWKITRPMRWLMRTLKTMVRRVSLAIPGIRTFYRWLAAVKGLGYQQVKFNQKHFGTLEGSRSPLTPHWQELLLQEKAYPNPDIRFSIIVPLYNTPENYLRDMIQSVIGQTYTGWELCLADGSDAQHNYVEEVVRQYAKKYPAIRYQKLNHNGGISANSNAAMQLATGDYIALLDHDDILNLNALFEVRQAIENNEADFMYSDEITFVENDLADVTVAHFKPDFAIDNLRANNYICHLTVFKKSLLELAGGGFRDAYNGSQDYDLVLRLTEQAKKIVHIPKVLYFWRSHQASVASSSDAKPYAIESAIKAISSHLERSNLRGNVQVAPGLSSMYKINYELTAEPLVSIIIPNKDECETLHTCIQSIFNKTTYSRYEIIVCENNSCEKETFAYYNKLCKDTRITLLEWKQGFNYSAINNYSAKQANGEILLFLNNDTEIISPNWIQEMLMYAQRADVGAVGAKLYYPDDTLQHGGLVLGMLALAGHVQRGLPRESPGYMGNLKYARNVSAVTAACLMMRRQVFEEVGGFNEDFEVAFNDVDLCMKIRDAHYLLVFTPFAELYHYESKSRGDDVSPEKRNRFITEVEKFQGLWARQLNTGDPYFNPNFQLDTLAYQYDLTHSSFD